MNYAHTNFTLILTGGGMRCAWSGGFLYGLYEQGITPTKIIASSGNVGNAVYFLAWQLESIKRIWTEHLPGTRFISYSQKPIIDIDYLVDDVFHTREPIAWDRVRASNITLIVPLYEKQGNVHTFTENTVTYDVLRAAKAMPLLYGKTVDIDGFHYHDHPFTPHNLLSYTDPNEHILLLDTREQNPLIKMIGKWAIKTQNDTLKEAQNVHVIRPSISAHLLSRDKRVLSDIFEAGRQESYKTLVPITYKTASR